MRLFAPNTSPFTPSEPSQEASPDHGPFQHSPNNGTHRESPPTPAEPSATTAPASSSPAQKNADDRLAVIREVLVGDQIDVLEERFAHLEGSLESHSAQLVEQIKSKFDAAHELYKSDLDEIKNQVDFARKDNGRTEHALERVTERLSDAEKKHDELRDALSRQINDLRDELTRNFSDFTRVMKDQYLELSGRMVAKSELSSLFGNFAGSLTTNPDQNQNGS